jgi:rsbT co-antagonist protein RsbR
MVPSPEQSLMRSMGLSREAIDRRKAFVGLTAEDLREIAALKKPVQDTVDKHVDAFFAYLATLPEAQGLTQNPQALARARQLKRAHLIAMVEGEYGEPYVEQRLSLAQLYSKVALEPAVFLGAFNHLLRSLESAADGHFGSLRKIAFFDLALITDVLVHERERVIRLQSEAIRELSTPVLQVRDRLLLIPIIGMIDTHRAQLIMENVLDGIRGRRAKVVVMDVTGVSTIDSGVANHVLRTITAAKLMGATVIVTGISADVAQALVSLGINLDEIRAVGDLQSGIEDAERLLEGD